MKQHQGIALIQVLLITAILSVFALYLTQTAKEQVTIAQWGDEKALALVALHSAEAELLFTLLTEQKKYPIENSSQDNEIVKTWNFHNQAFSMQDQVTVKMQDQSGLMYAYQPDNKLLTTMLTTIGATTDEANNLVARLIDWQDLDNIPRLNGSESAGQNMPPRNAKVADIHEFSFIEGITSEQLNLLLATTSLYKQASFNPMVAPESILAALFAQLALGSDTLNQVIELRKKGQLSTELFEQLTKISENNEQEILFYITNNTHIKLTSTVGESSVSKSIILNVNPYATRNIHPINLYSNRG
jgi:general secretion pathway protein K